MILTITLNPSMDFIYSVDDFVLGANNRTNLPVKMPGGKGINCTRALMYLKADVLAYTILGGENGSAIRKYLENENMPLISKKISKNSRNSYTIMHNGGIQTEIVENGPKISKLESNEIIDEIINIVNAEERINIVTVNGSINNDDDFYYVSLLTALREKVSRNLVIIMDQSKKSLSNIVNNSVYSPDFIKPNEVEFAELFNMNTEQISKESLIRKLTETKSKIPNILVSLGGNGAVAKFKGNIYEVSIPSIKVVNPTGSGDSTVAGVASAIARNYNDKDIIRYAMACGMANTLEEGVGVLSLDNVENLFDQIEVTLISKEMEK